MRFRCSRLLKMSFDGRLADARGSVAMVSRVIMLASALTGAAFAQEVSAPGTEPVGPARGDNTGDYNVVNSVETGYRFNTVGGSLTEYRSQENFGNGLRLLGSSLTVN